MSVERSRAITAGKVRNFTETNVEKCQSKVTYIKKEKKKKRKKQCKPIKIYIETIYKEYTKNIKKDTRDFWMGLKCKIVQGNYLSKTAIASEGMVEYCSPTVEVQYDYKTLVLLE